MPEPVRRPIRAIRDRVFGPQPRGHEVRVPKKVRKAALRSALEGLWADRSAPEHLKPQIQRALRTEALTVVAEDADDPVQPTSHASEPPRASPCAGLR